MLQNMKEFDTKSIVKHAVQGILPQAAGSNDADLVTRLCIMAAVPTGEENPHELLRAMSDGVIDAFAARIDEVRRSPIGAPIAQFFLLEWCYRHDYFNSDWKWEWDASDEGHAAYDSKEPLDILLQKAKTPQLVS